MIEEVLRRFEEGSVKDEHIAPNMYYVEELLQCRKKLEFAREMRPYGYAESDVTRRGKISDILHSALQVELRMMGWRTDVRFAKIFGKYMVYCRPDAAIFPKPVVHGVVIPDKIIEVKCPKRNSIGKGSIPDYYMKQIGMFLNITSADECILMVLAANDFSEKVITERMTDEDILWLIEEGAKSPWYPKECDTCWYRSYCDVAVHHI